MRKVMLVILLLGLTIGQAIPAYAADALRPLPGPVARVFDPPSQPWLRGHRGVDLLGVAGDSVVSAMAGRVAVAGFVAGRPVVAVAHGGLRTTYLPVSASVKVGTQVRAGQVIGRLVAGHPCPAPGACLHWGLKQGDKYLDPLSLLAPAQPRLVSAGAADAAERLARHRDYAIDNGDRLAGLLSWPADGPITSRFGMRRHPIFGDYRMHYGVDLSAACGTAIRAAAGGVVTRVSYDQASGHRLEIDHGVIGGHRLRTGYLHASGYTVRPGSRVTRNQLVGRVGSTGWSTGCHLHLAAWVDGRSADPERFW